MCVYQKDKNKMRYLSYRRLVPITVVAITTAIMAVLVVFASPSWSQSPGEAKPSPVDKNAVPGVEMQNGEVHSWALTPAGSQDPTQSGTRPSLSYELEPGAQIEDQLTLFNLGNVQLTFDLYATDAFNNVEGTFDLLPGSKRPTDVGKWITFPQKSVTLPPQTQATMPISIKVPSNARPGDHAGAVLASSQVKGSGADGKIITLDRRTGTRIYIRVAGPLTPELAVEKLRTTYQPSLDPTGGTAEVTYRVENRGNVRLGGTHSVSISAPFGIAKRSNVPVKLPDVLLPGQGVTINSTIKGIAATGLAVTKVEIDPIPAGPESKSAKASPISKKTFSLAIPFTVIAVALSVLLIRRARRSYLSHKLDQSGETTEKVMA